MIPISLTLSGIGPYRDSITLDYSSLRSPVALVASYGTGKTWLMEGLLLALYGRAAWYQGSIYDCLSQGGTGEGSVRLRFLHGDTEYLATREIKDTGKTKSQKATLYGFDDEIGAKTMLAGPKVSDFDRAITALLGIDFDTFLATAFLSQNRANDLCGNPGEPDLVARRRSVFNALIGADTLDAYEKRCAERTRELEAVCSELESQLAGEPDHGAAIMEAMEASQAAQLARDEAAKDLAKAESRLELARCKLRDAEGGDDILRAQIAEHERAVKAAQDAQARVNQLKAEVETLEKRASGLEQAEADQEALRWARIERDKLTIQQIEFDRYEAWHRTRDTLKTALKQNGELIASLEAVPGADDAARELAAKLPELRKQFLDAQNRNKEIAADNLKLAAARNLAVTEISSLTRMIDSTDKRIASKPITPFGEKCEPCPLMREYAGLPAERAEYAAKLEAAKARLAAIPEDTAPLDTAELMRQGTEAKAAAEAVQAAEATRQKIEQARAEVNRIVDALSELEASPPDPVADPREEMAATQKEIDRLSGAPERVKACEQAAKDLAEKQLQRSALTVDLENLMWEEAEKKSAAESARAALADRESQRVAIRAEVGDMQDMAAMAKSSVEAHAAAIARQESRIEDLQKRQCEQAEKRARAQAMRSDLDAVKDLRLCFGPRGVRQILIDNAAPELEAIADDLFERATAGRQRLRIATQTVNADGSTREDFQILVRDERGERDALRYSGGQLQLIQILFRISVALWVGRLRGHKPECLFLDEAFDRLGAEGTEDLLRVLEYLQNQISLIVVVTHDNLIAERMASQVRLVRAFGGVQIELRKEVAA